MGRPGKRRRIVSAPFLDRRFPVLSTEPEKDELCAVVLGFSPVLLQTSHLGSKTSPPPARCAGRPNSMLIQDELRNCDMGRAPEREVVKIGRQGAARIFFVCLGVDNVRDSNDPETKILSRGLRHILATLRHRFAA